MALISCPECGHQVSDKAALCPSCGVSIAPDIGREEHEKKLTTTQLTSKSLKMQSALSGGLFIIGFLIGITSEAALFYFIALFSFIWWLTTRIRIWWHHD